MNGLKVLLDVLHSQGWTVVRARRHWKLIPPFHDGMIVVMSYSASDHRALANMRADVRRSYRMAGRGSPV